MRETAEQRTVFVGTSRYEPVIVQSAKDYNTLLHENATLRASIAELEELNKHDPLTGLYNRNAYRITLESEYGKVMLGETPAFGVARIDLDRFSWVNDFMGGHVFGDMYLSILGKMLTRQFRSAEGSAFRIGGDEFSLIIHSKELTKDSFSTMMSRIHGALNGTVLKEAIDVIGRANRLATGPTGKVDREGTIALKELIHGIVELRDNVNGAQDHFLEHGRGKMTQKQDFLRSLTHEHLERFDRYRNDTRVQNELNQTEQMERAETEKDLAHTLVRLFPNLTLSMAGVYVDNKTNLTPLAIDKKVDMMVGALKRKGGATVSSTSV